MGLVEGCCEAGTLTSTLLSMQESQCCFGRHLGARSDPVHPGVFIFVSTEDVSRRRRDGMVEWFGM